MCFCDVCRTSDLDVGLGPSVCHRRCKLAHPSACRRNGQLCSLASDIVRCDVQGAIEDFDAALALDPDNKLALQHRASLRMAAMDFQVQPASVPTTLILGLTSTLTLKLILKPEHQPEPEPELESETLPLPSTLTQCNPRP